MLRTIPIVLVALFGIIDARGQYFPLIYGSEEWVLPAETIELSNGDFMSAIAVSTEVEGDTQFGTQLLRFNDEGEILDVVLLSIDSIIPAGIERSGDGNLLLLCQKTVDVLGDIRFPIVYKITEMGEILWVKEYPFRNDFDSNDILVLENNDFIFSATDRDSPIVNYDVLVRCNQFGDTLWTREYIEFEDEYAKRLRKDFDGNILVVGDARQGWAPDEQGFLRKVDADGETIWRRLHSIADTSLAYRDVLPLNGEYVLMGNLDNSTGYLRQIDASGQELTSRFLGTEESLYLFELNILENEDFVIAGQSNSNNGNGNDVYFCILDNNLNIDIEETYGGSESDGGTSCFVTLNQQVLLSARTRSFNAENNREAYFLLIDSIGQIVTSLQDNSNNNSRIHFSPNPTIGIVQIELPFNFVNGDQAISEVSVLDALGRQIPYSEYEIQDINSESLSLNLDALPSGIYLIRLVSEAGAYSARILKQ